MTTLALPCCDCEEREATRFFLETCPDHPPNSTLAYCEECYRGLFEGHDYPICIPMCEEVGITREEYLEAVLG